MTVCFGARGLKGRRGGIRVYYRQNQGRFLTYFYAGDFKTTQKVEEQEILQAQSLKNKMLILSGMTKL